MDIDTLDSRPLTRGALKRTRCNDSDDDIDLDEYHKIAKAIVALIEEEQEIREVGLPISEVNSIHILKIYNKAVNNP